MKFAIPSKGRAATFPEKGSLPYFIDRKDIFLFVERAEAAAYADCGANIVVIPDNVVYIPNVRQYVHEYMLSLGDSVFFQLDDDVRIRTRKGKPTDEELEDLIQSLSSVSYALPTATIPFDGLPFSEQPPHRIAGWNAVECVCSFYAPWFAERPSVKWTTGGSDLIVDEGAVMALSCYLQGYPSIVDGRFAKDRNKVKTGGCNSYRTPLMIDKSREELKRAFPDYVELKRTSGRSYGETYSRKVLFKKALDKGHLSRKGVPFIPYILKEAPECTKQ